MTTPSDFRSQTPSHSRSSRSRFDRYLDRVKTQELPSGKGHSSTPNRGRQERIRTSKELLSRFFGLLNPFRWQVVGILFSLTVATVLALIPPAGTKFVVDYVLTDHPLPELIASRFPTFTDRRSLLIAVVVIVVAISLCKIIVHICGRWYATRITKRIQLDVRRRVFEHAVRLPLHRVQEIRSGGVASILREDGGSVGELVFGLLYNPWRAIIQLLGSLIVLAWVDWTLLLGALVLLPLVYFSHHTWIARIRPQFRAIRRQRQFIDAGAAETFAGMRIVRAFSRQRREAGRFIVENNLMVRKELLAWWWMRSVEMVWEAMIPLTSAALMLYGGWRVIDGVLTIGDLMMFLVYLLMLLQPLAILAQSATQLQNSLSGLDRILDLLDEPKEMQPTVNSLRVSRCTVAGQIKFDNVTFEYPGADGPALKDINLEVAAGQTVALVGPSGSGKTTLCNLVARFYDPQFGTVKLDGRDLRDYDVESFRSLLGVVEQDVFLFDGTIADNINYANRDASPKQVQVAADTAHASEFIERQADGMNTLIGERGVRLSGGQRQRLAIARAILADPRLLILDEATSSLDTDSERLIQSSLAELMQNRTSFVIAHRLSTIAGADLICVLEHGQIVQTGTHLELMGKGGRYRMMVEQQVQMATPGAVAGKRTGPQPRDAPA